MSDTKFTPKQLQLYRMETPQLMIGDGIVRCGKSKSGIYDSPTMPSATTMATLLRSHLDPLSSISR